MKKVLVTLLFFVFSFLDLILISNPVCGQSYQAFRDERDSIISRARWQFGRFLIYPSFRLDLGHDNNIYGTNESLNPVPDYVATFSLPFSIYLLFRDWLTFTFSDIPAYDYYFEQKQERSFNNRYALSLRLLLFNRFSLSGGYLFSRAKYRVSSEIDQRVYQVTKRYNGSLFFDTFRSTSFGVAASIVKFSYEDITLPGAEVPLAVALNREERNERLEFYYRIFSDSFFFANFGYTEYHFDDPQSNFRDSYSYQTYAGIRFPLIGRARGNLTVGYKKFVPRQKGQIGFSGIVGDTGLSFRASRFGIRIGYVRDIPFSYYTNNIFYLFNSYEAGISFYLTQSIRLDYDFSYGGGHYPDPMQIVLPDGSCEEIIRQDIYRTHSVGVVFRIIRSIGIGLRADYWKRESNDLNINVERTLISAYITYEF